MTIRTHKVKCTSKDIFSFDCSTSSPSIPETTLTTQQGSIFHYRYPSYSCKCRRGYSLFSDPFNDWKLQEETAYYSRSDIKRACRLGKWY